MVFQDVVLFRDTVMENIRLGRRGATDEEVLEAAKAAQCDEFIRKLPQGYQTVIGENGSNPLRRGAAADLHCPGTSKGRAGGAAGRGHRQPGCGERKRRPDRSLSRLLQGKTVLVIAHRMRTVAGADHIVVLEDGHVAQQGTPAELMSRAASTAAWWSSRARAPGGGWVHDFIHSSLLSSFIFREYNILCRQYTAVLAEDVILPFFLLRFQHSDCRGTIRLASGAQWTH